jgi:hypothetical protein
MADKNLVYAALELVAKAVKNYFTSNAIFQLTAQK